MRYALLFSAYTSQVHFIFAFLMLPLLLFDELLTQNVHPICKVNEIKQTELRTQKHKSKA
jgi:hypothetical protein